jgi:predicted transcriptional regulator of viral defense system
VDPSRPQWDELYAAAAAQEGLFSTQQAAAAGYSPQLLAKYLRNGRVQRVRRGVYRLVHFPAGEHEDLVAVWLWTERQGVFSHQTALALHELSDVLPSRVHVTVPAAWTHRRFRLPPGVVLHHADVPIEQRAWSGAVPVTAPTRTIADCAAAHVSPEMIDKAVHDALRRGLASADELNAARASAGSAAS